MSKFPLPVFQCKTAKEVQAAYDKWAEEYDATIARLQGDRFVALGKSLQKHCPIKTIRILDMGAGTGLVGAEIKKLGFENLDAHDGSEKMLELARKKGIYKCFYHQLIEPDNSRPSIIPKHTYDVVIGSGIISPGHMNSDHLMSLIAPLKQGGKFVLCINEMYLTYPRNTHPDWNYEVEARMKEMEADGIWKLIEKRKFPNYGQDHSNGVIMVYEKL